MTTARCPATVAGVFSNRAEADRAVEALHEAGFRTVYASTAASGVPGMTDALVGLGVPEAEAPWYENEFRSGRTVVTVASEGRPEEAWSILHRFGAYNRTFPATGRAATAAAAETAGRTMQLHEEELRAQKQ
ncbi:MAG TPA: hypothetical protein VJ739_00475, partial [Gemmataceae bacterium]|nr:hypothetical protein [Gemmataceae bacterium]